MNNSLRILFLASNPQDTTRLRLDEEIRTIQERLRASQHAENIQLIPELAVRRADLSDALLRHKPHIVHFSGHGDSEGLLYLEDEHGLKQPVAANAIAGLFKILAENIRCVVLNACYSQEEAQAIGEHIDCVIGMPTTILDPASIAFAGGFYRGLGWGQSIQTAFELGCNEIDLAGIDQITKPVLFHRAGINPGNIFLVTEITETDEKTAPKVLHNLPQPDYGTFIGREQQIEQIKRILRPYPHSQHALVTIDGIGGIGKSALALDVAHSYLRQVNQIPFAERFDAIVWISAKETILTAEGIQNRPHAFSALRDLYSAIASVLGNEAIPRARPEEQHEVVRKALSQQRTLLVIDNLETVDDETVLTFLRELPAPTKAIITSRHRLDVAFPIRVVGMSLEESHSLINQECQKKQVALEGRQIQRLYDHTGGVPLAIVWSIAQMGMGYPVKTVLNRLAKPSSDIARFCFEATIQQLSDKPAFKLLLALSLFNPDASREALGTLSGYEELDRDDGLVELEKLSLVNKQANRFSLLPLTQRYALAELDKAGIKRGLIESFVAHYEAFVQLRGWDNVQRFTELDPEQINISLALNWADEFGLYNQYIAIMDRISGYLDRRGQWQDLIHYASQAVKAGMKINDRNAIARHKCFGLGWIQIVRLGELEKGLKEIQEAKQITLETGNPDQYAICLYNEASYYHRKGNHQRSIELLTEALGYWENGNNRLWLNRALGKLGSAYKRAGDLEKAMGFICQAIALAEENKDLENIALGERRLSGVYLTKGNYEEALLHARRCAEIADALNLHPTLENNIHLARVEFEMGLLEDAERHAKEGYQRALRLGFDNDKNKVINLLDQIAKKKIALG